VAPGLSLVHRKVPHARAFVLEAGTAQAAHVFAVHGNYAWRLSRLRIYQTEPK